LALNLNTNVASLTVQRNLTQGSRRFNQAIQRLSSGLRISSAADNPAGMAIRENMRAQLGGFKQAHRNANDAAAMLQIAESGLQSISDLYVRMRELSVQAANDSVSDTERSYLDTEYQDLRLEIERVSNVTEYNGRNLLDGASGNKFVSGATGPSVSGYGDGTNFSQFTYQVGTRNSTDNRLVVDIASGVFADMATQKILTQAGAQTSISTIDKGLDLNNRGRARLGAKINIFAAAADHLSMAMLNYEDSISQIADTDMAEESSVFSRQQVLRQVGVAMLAQANQQPNLVLRLLG